jgi:hypothetical protein
MKATYTQKKKQNKKGFELGDEHAHRKKNF